MSREKGKQIDGQLVGRGELSDGQLVERCELSDEQLVGRGEQSDGQFVEQGELSDGQVLNVQIKRCDKTLPLPEYAYPSDAGLDLRATVDCSLMPLERKMISTGLKIAIPDGYAGFVLPRSGLAAKQGLSLVNSPGLIDCKYRGELCVIAINLDAQSTINIKKGDRIAQLVIMPVPKVKLVEAEYLELTERSDKGFGSSGLE